MGLEVPAPSAGDGVIALKVALSATADDGRICAVVGEDVAIRSLSTPAPQNDLLKQQEDLARFRSVVRGVLNRFKAKHCADRPRHIFPAMPVATAVELGRV